MEFKLEIRPGTFADRAVVDRLMELYLYDYSEFDGFDVDEHGVYRYDNLDYYWMERSKEILVFKVNGHWAGFAMTSAEVVLPGSQKSLDNFFILRKYRRHGLGKLAAQEIFALQPAAWEMCILAVNLPALQFWRKVAATLAPQQWQEHLLDTEDWRGPVISLDNRVV